MTAAPRPSPPFFSWVPIERTKKEVVGDSDIKNGQERNLRTLRKPTMAWRPLIRPKSSPVFFVKTGTRSHWEKKKKRKAGEFCKTRTILEGTHRHHGARGEALPVVFETIGLRRRVLVRRGRGRHPLDGHGVGALGSHGGETARSELLLFREMDGRRPCCLFLTCPEEKTVSTESKHDPGCFCFIIIGAIKFIQHPPTGWRATRTVELAGSLAGWYLANLASGT